jgi:hypothetical protein
MISEVARLVQPRKILTAQIHLKGTPFGHRPVAAITSLNTTYECVCKECTTVEFASAAADEDSDLQSLSWKLDGAPQIGDGTSARQTLDLHLPVGAHTVTLAATDTRGGRHHSGPPEAFRWEAGADHYLGEGETI